MPLTFRGGVRVGANRSARRSPIEICPAPGFVNIPVSQHIGAHAVPVVRIGDTVDKGQVIAAVPDGAELSCPVHASVSGRVLAIEQGLLPMGVTADIIRIENDYADRLHAGVKPADRPINDISAEEIIEIIKQAGVAGLGGAAFPAYAKLRAAAGKVSALIINGAECEPYLAGNHRLMLERPELIANGVKILVKALGLKKGIVAIADNKLNAADAVTAAAGKSKLIDIKILRSKYPQGDERQLIYAVSGREVPAGKLPIDSGYIVFNAATCAAICQAFTEGTPLIDRVVTVDGDCIAKPRNLRVPLGAPISGIIEHCGLKREPAKIIIGGAMTGITAFDISAPIIKSTVAVLVFSERKIIRRSAACIRCGRCAEACPINLQPLYLAMFAQKGDMQACEKYDAMSCTECGCCQYACPANVPIVQAVRTAKGRISAARIKGQLIAEAKEPGIAVSAEYKGRAAAAGYAYDEPASEIVELAEPDGEITELVDEAAKPEEVGEIAGSETGEPEVAEDEAIEAGRPEEDEAGKLDGEDGTEGKAE